MCEASERTKRFFKCEYRINDVVNACSGNEYHESDNPNGIISLAMSVNDCVWDLVKEKLTGVDMGKMPRSYIHYNEGAGTKQFREAIAQFLTR